MHDLLARLRRYVEMESPSGDAARIGALAQVIATDLEEAGASVERIDAGAAGMNLHIRVEGRTTGKPILILGHIDTVWPAGTIAERPFRIEDGRAYGPGTYDMKAGIALVTEALTAMRRDGTRPRRPLELLINCDEEVGSESSRPLIEARALEAESVLVLEPCITGGAAKTARKGITDYRLAVHGRAAHSGIEPAQGVSAILELAAHLLEIVTLADPQKGTTINVGRIAGGSAVNVVPAEAWADVEARYWTAAEGDRVRAALQSLQPKHAGATLELQGGRGRPPLERTEGVIALYQRARAIAESLGMELGEGAVGGASDGNWTGALGIPTLDGLGAQGDGAHAIHEHVQIADMEPRLRLIRRLLETL